MKSGPATANAIIRVFSVIRLFMSLCLSWAGSPSNKEQTWKQQNASCRHPRWGRMRFVFPFRYEVGLRKAAGVPRLAASCNSAGYGTRQTRFVQFSRLAFASLDARCDNTGSQDLAGRSAISNPRKVDSTGLMIVAMICFRPVHESKNVKAICPIQPCQKIRRYNPNRPFALEECNSDRAFHRRALLPPPRRLTAPVSPFLAGRRPAGTRYDTIARNSCRKDKILPSGRGGEEKRPARAGTAQSGNQRRRTWRVTSAAASSRANWRSTLPST